MDLFGLFYLAFLRLLEFVGLCLTNLGSFQPLLL